MAADPGVSSSVMHSANLTNKVLHHLHIRGREAPGLHRGATESGGRM